MLFFLKVILLSPNKVHHFYRLKLITIILINFINNLIMNYAYIKVSTESQSIENQRYEINNFASSKNIQINKWIEEAISSVERLD